MTPLLLKLPRLLLLLLPPLLLATPPTWGRDPVDVRVAALLAQMTVEEKVAQLTYGISSGGGGGAGGFAAWRNAQQRAALNASRLGIPASFYGETLRSASVPGSTTYPVGAALGASWNPALIYAVGRAIAEECAALGVDRSLSPVIQIATDPRWGRQHENFGEVPAHTGVLGAAMTRGLLGPNSLGGPSTYLSDPASVIATAKHALAYGESSTDGYTTDVSERKLYDAFVRPWREFALAGGRGMMASHESLNFVPLHANAPMLDGLLRKQLGFGGALIGSDEMNVDWLWSAFFWSPNASAAAVDAVTAGVDQEMGDGLYAKYLPAALASGQLAEATLDRAAGNSLRAKFAANLFDTPLVNESLAPLVVHSDAHVALARTAATEGIVLLGNAAGLLPLGVDLAARFGRVAVIGPNGGGCDRDVTQLCKARLNQVGNYGPFGAAGPAAAAAGGASPFGVYLVEDALRAQYPALNVSYARGADIDSWAYNGSLLGEAAALAQGSDLVFLVLGDSACNGGGPGGFGGCTCGEGADRTSLDLPGTQQLLLQAVLNATGNLAGAQLPLAYQFAGITPSSGGRVVPVVVVLIHGRPVTFDAANRNWLQPGAASGSATALLTAWLPSEQGGLAILDVATGAASPSGKLAQAWPRSGGHVRSPSSPSWQQPNSQGTGPFFEPRNGDGGWAPLFPLLHGLSYTNFSFSGLSASPPGPVALNTTWAPSDIVLTLSVTVNNTGARAGAVVVAAFFSVHVPKVIRWARTLAAFDKVVLAAGASAVVQLPVRRIDVDRWEPQAQDWVVDRGDYTFFVGDCSSTGGLYVDEEPCAQQRVHFLVS